MHKKQKMKPRLPVGVVEKLQKNTGGGAHRNQKADYTRHPKHRKRYVGESFRFAIFIKFIIRGGFVEVWSLINATCRRTAPRALG